jgi:hypothetical protein
MLSARVRYIERQILRAEDLADEQAYRIAAQQRHLVGQHPWGIVHGLGLRTVPGGFAVMPGYAVDGFGRELMVPRPIFISGDIGGQSLFDELGSERYGSDNLQFIDVWLRYDRLPADTERRGRGECRPSPAQRWRDAVQVCLREVRGGAEAGEPPAAKDSRPPLVSGELRAAAPHAPLPDDPHEAWPLLLGRLVSRPDDRTHPYGVEHDGRCYAGLVAASVVSASRVAVAEDPESPPIAPPPPVPSAQIAARQSGERRRVAVTLADSAGAQADALALDTLAGAALRGTARLIGRPPDPERPLARDAASDLIIGEADLLTAADISDPAGLARLLDDPDDPPPEREREGTDEAAAMAYRIRRVAARRQGLALGGAAPRLPSFDPQQPLPERLAGLLETWLKDPRPLDPNDYIGLPLRAATRRLLTPPRRQRPLLARRALLEDLFREQIVARAAPPSAYGVELRPAKQPPKPAPGPWRIYSVEIERDGKRVRQLRIELGTAGDRQHPERNQLVVGHGSEGSSAFAPCLRVDESGTVFVEGAMTVVGELIEDPIPAEPGDLGVLEQLAEEWQRGIAEGLAEQASLTVEIRALNSARANTEWPYEVYLKNEGAAPLSFISVLENVSVGNDFSARTAATLLSLPAGGEQTLQVRHPTLLPATASAVGVMITVLGFGPAFNAIYVSKGKSVPVVP